MKSFQNEEENSYIIGETNLGNDLYLIGTSLLGCIPNTLHLYNSYLYCILWSLLLQKGSRELCTLHVSIVEL